MDPATQQVAASLTAYEPSLRERIGNATYDIANYLGMAGIANRMRNDVETAVDFVPFVGDAIGFNDAGRDIGAGNYGSGAMGLGLATLGLVPGAGDVLKKAGQEAFSRAKTSASLYNFPNLHQRDFNLDYAEPVDGQLTRTIDGDPIIAKYVVGRTQAGGSDMALPRDAYDEIAKAATGSPIDYVPQKTIGRNLGLVEIDRRSREPISVLVSANLSDSQLEKVTAHEIGHVIDQVAGEIDTKGLSASLREIYNSGNNPNSYQKKTIDPKVYGYTSEEAPREMIAESLRAYLTNPNYIKSVAPDLAAKLRKIVNTHPKLSKVVQLNSLAGTLGGSLVAKEALFSGKNENENKL